MHAPGQGALGGDDRELLGLLADGWSQGSIARVLGLSHGELRSLIRGTFDRLGVSGPSPSSAARLVLVHDALRVAPSGD